MTSEELASKMDRLQESIDLNNSLMTEFNNRLASIQESVSNKRGRMDAKEIVNYPRAKDSWASGFAEERPFKRLVLTPSPPV